MFSKNSTTLVKTARYAEIILTATPLSADGSFLEIAWLSRADAHTGAVYRGFECTTFLIGLLFASLGLRMLKMIRTKLALHLMALAARIFAESIPLASFSLYLIDILIYRIKLCLVVSLPSWVRPIYFFQSPKKSFSQRQEMKANSHGSVSILPIRSVQHSSWLLMYFFSATLIFFHASCSKDQPSNGFIFVMLPGVHGADQTTHHSTNTWGF